MIERIVEYLFYAVLTTITFIMGIVEYIVSKVPVKQTTMTYQPSIVLYNVAKASLGKHMTLDDNVPPELGCAEAWCAIAKNSGVEGLPIEGFPGTPALAGFLASSHDFEEIQAPEPGATIISISEGNQHGHVGYLAQFGVQYVGDWGVMSNDSNTGTVREQWCLKDWQDYYSQALGLVTKMYRWRGIMTGI